MHLELVVAGSIGCRKERHGIHRLRMQFESLSVDASSVEPFQNNIHELIESHQLLHTRVFENTSCILLSVIQTSY